MYRLAAEVVARKVEDITSFEKVGEGAANRAFVIQFRDDFRLVASIPYTITEPRKHAVASEAATMTVLRSKGIPVPEIYGCLSTTDNPAQTEYMFLEYQSGKNLGAHWGSMDEHDRCRFLQSLVRLEDRLFNLRFPASGSLYFRQDLDTASRKIPVDSAGSDSPDSVCMGPSVSLPLWYGKRSELDVERGPCGLAREINFQGQGELYWRSADTETGEVLNAGAKKEIEYLTQNGRPLFPFNCMYREIFGLKKQLPSTRLDSLQKYLQTSSRLIPRGEEHNWPVIRYPDLRPSNILVSDDFEITSLIDWQHAVVLPLFLQSGIPDLDGFVELATSFPESPSLPDNSSALDEDNRQAQLELFHKRKLHHFYMTETSRHNLTH
jgi:hypothetical protein